MQKKGRKSDNEEKPVSKFFINIKRNNFESSICLEQTEVYSVDIENIFG